MALNRTQTHSFLNILGVITLIAYCLNAQADDVWGIKGYTDYTRGLTTASSEVLKKTTKNYWVDLQRRAKLDLSKIKVVTFSDIDPILERAARLGLGTLDLFTKQDLANPEAAALLLDGPTLRRIDEKYDLSSIWMISARSTVPGQRPLNMDYMIVGQGKLVIGYPVESSVEVIDDGKAMEYRYEPFIAARIINTQTQQGLFEVKALTNPTGEFQYFQGPLGASINSLELKGDGIIVNYTLGFTKETRSDRKPIALKPVHVSQAEGVEP